MSDFVSDHIRNLKYREWKAPSPKDVVLLIHGLGAHSGRWSAFAEDLVAKGISSYAIDLVGFGENAQVKGHISSFETYYEDISRLYDVVRQENPESKIYLVGESMGGLIAFMAVSMCPGRYDGLVCWSPAFINAMPFSLKEYFDLFFALLHDHKKRFRMPFRPDMYTRDPDMQKHVRSDRKEHAFASSKLLYNILMAQIKSPLRAKNIKVPVLFQLAGTDHLVSTAASEKIFKRVGSADKRIIVYPEMYHALSIDLGRETVFNDTFEWIKERS